MDNGLTLTSSEFGRGCLNSRETVCLHEYGLATVVLLCSCDFSYGCDFRLKLGKHSKNNFRN